MKIIVLTFVSFISLNSWATGAPKMACLDVEILKMENPSNPSYEKTDLAIVINEDASGLNGLVATISSVSKNKSDQEKDVRIDTVTPDKAGQVKDMAATMLPQVNWQDVKFVRAGNVGVKANQHDSGGIYIFELLDANDNILGKLTTIGWGFGRCSP